MNRKVPTEDEAISLELSEVLAEAPDTTPEEIEREAEEPDIESPVEAGIVGYGGNGPLTDSDSRYDVD